MIHCSRSMCFSIPVRVIKVNKEAIYLETGKTIPIDPFIHVKKGSYVRISGKAIVDCLTKEEGDSIRQLIAELNTPYEN